MEAAELDDETLTARIGACKVCAEHLTHGPRPVLSWHPDARILLIGQAPGRRVHESGVPWQDASGNLLREWLGVSEEEFYDPEFFALLPMGFCYPGKGKSGDLPPRPECAPLWHQTLRDRMPAIKLTLLIGRYAQQGYLGSAGQPTLTENVRAFASVLPEFFPLPHPSPRNRPWLAANPWFGKKALPELRRCVRRC